MKKFLTFVLAICLILPMSLLAACGPVVPFDVNNTTFSREKVEVNWVEGTTERQKETMINRDWGWQTTNETELLEGFQEKFTNLYRGIRFEDGMAYLALCKNGIDVQETEFYYVQSEDLKQIDLYTDSDCTVRPSQGVIARTWTLDNGKLIGVAEDYVPEFHLDIQIIMTQVAL